MQTHKVTHHEIENAEVDLSVFGNLISITDSKSKDSVVIDGVNRLQLAREIRRWVSAKRWSHYETAQDKDNMVSELQKLQDMITSVLDEMAPKQAETSK